MLEEYVEDNYYAKCDTRSDRRFRETHSNVRLDENNAGLDVKSQRSHSSVKSRSRVLGLSACLKSISRTMTVQSLTLAAITVSEKLT